MATVTTGTSSPITVTGLSSGSYNFTIYASNGIGDGTPSASFGPVTISAPSVLTVNRGTWSNQAPYAYDDYVTYNGTTWFCVIQTGVLGVTPGTDSTRWGTAPA